jgi:hypothetical protein
MLKKLIYTKLLRFYLSESLKIIRYFKIIVLLIRQIMRYPLLSIIIY